MSNYIYNLDYRIINKNRDNLLALELFQLPVVRFTKIQQVHTQPTKMVN